MSMAGTAPNILLIMADQLAPQFTSAYGHPLVKTPHMDALVERGMRFDNAYCNSPLCAPSRFSFMSGQLVTRIAAYDNASEFPASIPTFAHYLRAMGYRTCLSGKMHFVGPDQLHGFEERVTTDIYPADYAWTPDWELADERIDKWYHNMDSVREAGVAAATFQIDYDEETAFSPSAGSSITPGTVPAHSAWSPASSIRTTPMSRAVIGGISTMPPTSTCRRTCSATMSRMRSRAG